MNQSSKMKRCVFDFEPHIKLIRFWTRPTNAKSLISNRLKLYSKKTVKHIRMIHWLNNWGSKQVLRRILVCKHVYLTVYYVDRFSTPPRYHTHIYNIYRTYIKYIFLIEDISNISNVKKLCKNLRCSEMLWDTFVYESDD